MVKYHCEQFKEKEWTGDKYNVLNKNCQDFAKAFFEFFKNKY